MKAHYDIDQLEPVHKQGYFAEKIKQQGTNRILIRPELYKQFKNEEAINQALENYLKLERTG